MPHSHFVEHTTTNNALSLQPIHRHAFFAQRRGCQDSIHGVIELSAAEWRVVESMPFQRLRHIRQMGFADTAFPGATHTRYAHSLGAMHMASNMFDAVAAHTSWNTTERHRLRQMLRLSVLLHDVGHAPFSHASEKAMPSVSVLNLPRIFQQEKKQQATHEDYSVKILLESELNGIIEDAFAKEGIRSEHLASLITGIQLNHSDNSIFTIEGCDTFPLLSQMVSGELDADRMDYLRRDAQACGVAYGQFDHAWLLHHLRPLLHNQQWTLAVEHQGVWAFESFLLARYHMFLAVYYHHDAIGFDHMLGQFIEETGYTLPAHLPDYLALDDVEMLKILRHSENGWARSLVQRKPFALLLETHAFPHKKQPTDITSLLSQANIPIYHVLSQGVLSKYMHNHTRGFPLRVVEPEISRECRMDEYTPLYQRFADVVGISRIYCRHEDIERAKKILSIKNYI